MSSNQRSKRKSKAIEPITFDELRDAAGMSGFVSFLNLPPTDDITTPVDITPAVATLDTYAPSDINSTGVDMGSTPAATAGVVTAPVVIAPVDTHEPSHDGATAAPFEFRPALKFEAAHSGRTTSIVAAPVATTPVVITPVVLPRPGTEHVLYAPLKGGKNLYRCFTVQDGHSHLEEALYQLLWRTATVISPDVRIAQVSQSDLARQLRITDKNLRIALQRLVDKLSIEIIAEPDFALKTAKQYKTYSYRAILQRRREAGLEWVIRNKGVQFVSKQDADRYREAGTTPVDLATTGADFEPAPVTNTRDARSATPDAERTSTRVDTVGHLYRGNTHQGREVVDDVAPLSSTLEQIIRNQVDSEAARRILLACRAQAPDATIEEIIEQCWSKAQLSRSPFVASPVGFLIASVPKMFEGPDAPYLRRRREREQQRRELEEMERQLQQGTS